MVPTGGGARNAFGRDFAANEYSWTFQLCLTDSDGDGVSNGIELGDPCCLWTVSNNAKLITTGISHPGVATLQPTNDDLRRFASDAGVVQDFCHPSNTKGDGSNQITSDGLNNSTTTTNETDGTSGASSFHTSLYALLLACLYIVN